MDDQDLRVEYRRLVEDSKRIGVRKREIWKLINSGDRGRLTLKGTADISKRNAEMAAMYKGGKTLQEIGDMYGYSREYVRQLIKGFVDRHNGGRAARTRIAKSRLCKVNHCMKSATGQHGYCQLHHHRHMRYGTATPNFKTLVDHEDTCMLEDCDEPFKSNGLCNKHVTNYFINRQNGNIKDNG